MLTIEFESPREQGPCPCCGGRTTALTRFVHKDGNAHAVYLASYSDNHPEKVVSIAAGIGEWGDGTSPSDRVAFALQLRCKDNSYAVSVIDGNESPWTNAAFLGRLLSRAEAMAHPLVTEAFHLTDHMVLEDNPIIGYFSANGDA
jgi:hypothetical protein